MCIRDRYYDLLGNLTSKVYYLNDKIHGIAEYYYPGGKLDNLQYYDYGWFNKMERFDSVGRLISSSTLTAGKGKMQMKHFDGKPYFQSSYDHYILNGTYDVFHGDGSKASSAFYKNGENDSSYTACLLYTSRCV